MHIYGHYLQKNGIGEPLQGKNRDTHRECTCGHGVGGGRGGQDKLGDYD